jgi:tetrahydromethanopterin S-methyltransferase subunit A
MAPERPWAVALLRRWDALGALLGGRALGRRAGHPGWPVVPGAYAVGDRQAPVAVCTLTADDLVPRAAALPGVAIAGRVYTANLGVEKIVRNVTANPRIRFLLLCGRDSPLFRPGQTLRALCANGVTPERRVVGAEGYLPVLGGVPLARLERFRRQVELVDCTGETDLAAIAARARQLAGRDPGPFAPGPPGAQGATGEEAEDGAPGERFRRIRPGGKREPLAYDPKGYFVVTLARAAGEIVLRHYLPDNTPAHELRGRSGEALLLGLLREALVSQLSHAGYLGAELAKAESALRLGLAYEQDRPLRREAA